MPSLSAAPVSSAGPPFKSEANSSPQQSLNLVEDHTSGFEAPSMKNYKEIKREKDEAVKRAAEVQKQLDEARLENLQLLKFMEDIGLKLIKGPTSTV